MHAQLCLTLYDPMDCSPPGSSVHRIFQERKLEWLLFPTLGDLPNPEIKLASLASPALQVDFLLLVPPGKPSKPNNQNGIKLSHSKYENHPEKKTVADVVNGMK